MTHRPTGQDPDHGRRSHMWLAILVAAGGIAVAALLWLLGQSPAPSSAPAQDPASAVRNASPQPPLTFAPQPTSVTTPPTPALTRRRVAVTPTG